MAKLCIWSRHCDSQSSALTTRPHCLSLPKLYTCICRVGYLTVFLNFFWWIYHPCEVLKEMQDNPNKEKWQNPHHTWNGEILTFSWVTCHRFEAKTCLCIWMHGDTYSQMAHLFCHLYGCACSSTIKEGKCNSIYQQRGAVTSWKIETSRPWSCSGL